MRRILATIVTIASAASLAAFALGAMPATGKASIHIDPSPQVSATTLPQLPTVAPVEPTYAPTTLPAEPTVTPAVSVPAGSYIQVSGDVTNPKVFTLKDLELMRRTSLTLRVLDPDGKRRVHFYTGVLLGDLIAACAPTDPGGASTSATEFADITGVNGDSAIIAFPEFESAFNGKQVLVAYTLDGLPLAGANIGDLIVPEDQSPQRFIVGITSIRIAGP